MKKALAHYFSGTGNSLLAARQLGEELEKYGYKVVFHAIEDGRYNGCGDFELQLFFFPVYATAVPHIVRKYIRQLPDGGNVRAAVISTNGKVSTRLRDGYQGWALHQARIYLKLKHYNVFLSDTLDYPHNITLAIPPRKDRYNEEIIAQASKAIPGLAERIAGHQRYHRSLFYPNFIWSIPFGILYSVVGRRLIGKLYVADTSCTSCRLCVKECPVKAIKMSGRRITWRWNCEGCMRCINCCPRSAIQTSSVRLLLMLIAIFATPFNLLDNYIPGGFIQGLGNVGAAVFMVALNIVLFVIAILLMDFIFYLLSYIPILRNIECIGHTKLLGRYRAKRFEGLFIHKD